MLRWMFRLILVLVVAAAAGAAWLLSGASVPEEPETALPLEEVRARFAETGVADAVNVEIVAEGTLPAYLTTAWGGLGTDERTYPSFQIVTTTGSHIVDAPHPEHLHDIVPGAGRYYPAAFGRMKRSMDAAERLYITHTHGDHYAGIIDGDAADAHAATLAVNPAQKRLLAALGEPADPTVRNMGFPPALLPRLSDLEDAPYEILAPGLAVIAAPGHTAGHQIFFVKTEDHEILLLGDLVWSMTNITERRTRPRLIGALINEDQPRIADQIAALARLAETDPDIVLLPSHDRDALRAAVEAGVLNAGFD